VISYWYVFGILIAGWLLIMMYISRKNEKFARQLLAGKLPQYTNYGVSFYGRSDQPGPVRPKKGMLLFSDNVILFVRRGETDAQKITADNLIGFTVHDQFRGKDLYRNILIVQLEENGNRVSLGFDPPYPERWAMHLKNMLNGSK